MQQENVKALADAEEHDARDMEPDIRLLDTYQRELKDLDRQISLTQSKLQGAGTLTTKFMSVFLVQVVISIGSGI